MILRVHVRIESNRQQLFKKNAHYLNVTEILKVINILKSSDARAADMIRTLAVKSHITKIQITYL